MTDRQTELNYCGAMPKPKTLNRFPYVVIFHTRHSYL